MTARWPWIEILDARMGAPITSPRGLLEAIRQFCAQARRPLLLFDSLEAPSGLSAISQVERGERGLSLETLLALAGRLNITLDELLGGEVTPDYRIGRRRSLGDVPAGSVLPLLDDAEAGMRVYLVSMPRSATVEAPFTHKGTELVGEVGGLVQVLVGSGRPVLRRGETLLASRRGIDGWRNVGENDAQCLWVLRD